MMLFKSSNNFPQYEADTGWREYWVWTGIIEGWKHRTQVFDPAPLIRVFSPEKLPANYGTEEFQKQRIAESQSELKDHLKTLNRAKSTVRVK